MSRIQIWGGGPYHPYKAQGDMLRKSLESQGHSAFYGESRDVLEAGNLANRDLLVLLGLDCSGSEKVPKGAWEDPSRAEKAYQALSAGHAKALADFAAQGKPILVLHAGLISFDERKELKDLYDGRWILDKSFHPPLHEFSVTVKNKDHSICEGVSDFKIEDELYCDLVKPIHSTVLLEAAWEGKAQPLAWCRERGDGGKFVYIALGHDMRAWGNPALEKLHANAVRYLLS